MARSNWVERNLDGAVWLMVDFELRERVPSKYCGEVKLLNLLRGCLQGYAFATSALQLFLYAAEKTMAERADESFCRAGILVLMCQMWVYK
jgi:hypothetical protein